MFYPTKLPEGYEFLGSEFLKFFKRDDREVRALFLHHDGYTLDTLTFAQSPAARPETHRGVAATVHDLPARYGEEPGVFPLRWITWEEDGNRLTLRASGLSREDLLKLAEAVRSRPRKEIQQDPRQVISVDNFSEAAVQVPFLLFTPTWWPQPDYNMHRYLQISRHRLLPELEETPRVTLYLDRTSDADGNPISRSEGEWGEIRFEQWPAPGVPRPPERIPTEAIAIHDRLGWFYEEKPFPHRLARSVFWAERGTALALHSNRLTREQLLKMAESVKPATEAEVAPAMDTRIAQRMQAAIKALEARDADALYAVSHPQERAELNVTRATLRRLLSEIFAQMGPLQARAIVERTSSRCSEAQWVVEWEPASGAARSRLPQGAPTRPFIAVAQGGVAPGHEWAVKVTKSLYWLCQRALGLGRGTEAYIRACRKSGIGGILDSEGRLRRVEELEQELRDRKKAEQAARQRTAQDLATPEAASPGLQKKHPLQK
jgi:hypothetical protein